MWKKITLLSFIIPSLVEGHGYLSSPRSRNWVAHQDGTDEWSGGSAGVPVKEYCYHCLNSKAADEVCGTGSAGNYDDWLDSIGAPMPWNSQATYTEGEIITVKSFLSTNHKGHMDLFVCADGADSTQECFETHPLEFIEDLKYDAPKDVNYPHRGYYAPGVQDFEMKFKLPMGVTGDKVMMQWRYVTANSCIPPGYLNYDWPDPSWLGGDHSTCTYPLDPTGARCSGCPEQFWNCAEITIIPSNGPLPTQSPVAPSPVSPTTPAPTLSPVSGQGCCTIDFKACSPTVQGWCSESQENCEGPCDKWWLPNGAVEGCSARYETCVEDWDCCSPGVCTDVNGMKSCQESTEPTPTAPNPTPSTPYPTLSPITPAPAPSSNSEEYFSCTENSISSNDLLVFMDELTYTVSDSPKVLSILAEGGAAGSGGSVVSEGQGYGLLTSAIALASLEVSDSSRNDVMDKFYGYFNGWKRMCINSSPSPCQAPQYCTHDSGTAPCLPGWKHTGDLSSVVGTGAAPDGDEDAILGMIIAIKALEKGGSLPSWYDELRQWTDESCTQFLMDNTVLSSSGSHRLLKLGSCWGGWGSEGNNPSYHGPGAYRAMRDYHVAYNEARNYAMPNFGDNLSLEDKWNMLIDTSYKFFGTTQCTDTGLVPNWALVREVDSQSLEKQSGSFSGSGTPQYEFGAEASRTMWRVAVDALLFPDEASVQAGDFLEPVHSKMYNGFDGASGNWNQNTLQTCEDVTAVFSGWQNNGFMFGPVYSTLAVQATGMSAVEQQQLVNAACGYVGEIESWESYYSKSWKVISMMTLNGDLGKIGALLRGEESSPAPSPPPFAPPSPTPPSSGCYSNNYKDCLPDGYSSSDFSCNRVWLPSGARDNCVALWEECTGNLSSCCGSAECFGDNSYASCIPPMVTSAPTKSCRVKGEPCNSNSDCCKYKCKKSTKTCKK